VTTEVGTAWRSPGSRRKEQLVFDDAAADVRELVPAIGWRASPDQLRAHYRRSSLSLRKCSNRLRDIGRAG